MYVEPPQPKPESARAKKLSASTPEIQKNRQESRHAVCFDDNLWGHFQAGSISTPPPPPPRRRRFAQEAQPGALPWFDRCRRNGSHGRHRRTRLLALGRRTPTARAHARPRPRRQAPRAPTPPGTPSAAEAERAPRPHITATGRPPMAPRNEPKRFINGPERPRFLRGARPAPPGPASRTSGTATAKPTTTPRTPTRKPNVRTDTTTPAPRRLARPQPAPTPIKPGRWPARPGRAPDAVGLRPRSVDPESSRRSGPMRPCSAPCLPRGLRPYRPQAPLLGGGPGTHVGGRHGGGAGGAHRQLAGPGMPSDRPNSRPADRPRPHNNGHSPRARSSRPNWTFQSLKGGRWPATP